MRHHVNDYCSIARPRDEAYEGLQIYNLISDDLLLQ
jgi:hypothetical protein